MKRLRIFAILLLLSAGASAQGALDEAKREMDKENYLKAKNILSRILADGSADRTQTAYYLGTSYLKLDDVDSAKMMYRIPGNGNKSAYGYLCNGRLALLNGDKANAKELLNMAAVVSKLKNSEVLYQIGDAWFKPKITDLVEAIRNFEDAYKLDNKNLINMLALGDAYHENNEGGKAMSKYESALEVNSKLTLAYIKIGRQNVNGHIYDDAIAAYKKAIALEPDFALAHKELAEAYYLSKKYDLAKPEFKRYIELNKDDADAKTKFLSFLFSIKEYEQVISEGEKMRTDDPNNYLILRALSFANYELKRYKEGMETIRIFWMAAPSAKVKPVDYIYTAKIATQSGDTAMALKYFAVALMADTNNGDLLSDYGNLMYKTKRYYDAIATFSKKIGRFGGVFNDYYLMGRSKYYIAVSFAKRKDDAIAKDSAVQYFIASDSTFAQVTAKYPTVPEGWQYRAKANYNLDPEMKSGAAKPFYEQYIKVAEASADPTKYKNFLVESYQYLGSFSLATKDNVAARGYLNKALELDPADALTKELLKGL